MTHIQNNIIRMQGTFEDLGQKSLVNNIAATMASVAWLRRVALISFGIGVALTIYGIIKIITQ